MPNSDPVANPVASTVDPPPDPEGWPGQGSTHVSAPNRGSAAGVATISSGAPSSGAPSSGASAGLAALRAELDRIDDALHGLLMERARVVEQVARSGKPAAFRPGREASIIRRLLGQHAGGLPPVTLYRLWRELTAGTTAMQGRFVVAVGAPPEGEPEGQAKGEAKGAPEAKAADLMQLAREHFGALTPQRTLAGPEQALEAVRDGSAAVAIMPLPTDAHTWWTALGPERSLFVVARLPFWATRPEGASTAEALVIASTAPDPSGEDRSFLAFDVDPDLGRARIADELSAIGLPPLTIAMTGAMTGGSSGAEVRVLAELASVVAVDDAVLCGAGPWLRRPVLAGGYAIQVGMPPRR